MKKALEQQPSNEQTIMLVLAIILCVAALWAMGCGGGGGAYSSTPVNGASAPQSPSGSGYDY